MNAVPSHIPAPAASSLKAVVYGAAAGDALGVPYGACFRGGDRWFCVWNGCWPRGGGLLGML